MSRPIKYDAIYKATGDHFVPSEIDLINNAVSGYIDDNYGRYYFSLDGKYGDVILRQFTGLCDRNGKEIYEGDIDATFDDGYRFVTYKDGQYGLQYLDEPETFDPFILWERVEVIGNIYENPELLKGDSKDA